MDYVWYLFRFEGRINRARYWLAGFIILCCMMFLIALMAVTILVFDGTLPPKPLKNGQPGPATACAVIVKRVDERTRAKTSINELLRD